MALAELVQVEPIIEAVMTHNTNHAFKKAFYKIAKRHRENFLRMLNVDVNTVEPIFFNYMKYSKKEHGDNYFLFLDAECRIVGILQGSTWNKKWEAYESYYSGTGSTFAVIKNRKHMEEKSAYILMINDSMRTHEFYKLRPKPLAELTPKIAKESLRSRLQAYKIRKYRNLSHERVVQNSKDLMTLLSQNLFDNEFYEDLRPKYRKAGGWTSDDSLLSMMKFIADVISNYEKYHNDYSRSKSVYYEEHLMAAKVTLVPYFKEILGRV